MKIETFLLVEKETRLFKQNKREKKAQTNQKKLSHLTELIERPAQSVVVPAQPKQSQSWSDSLVFVMASVASLVLSTGITSAFVQVVLDRIANFAQNKMDLFKGVDNGLQKLERTLLKIQALVDAVESKQSIPKACQVLLEDLKSVLFDADDFLNEIGFDLERRNYGAVTPTNKNQVGDFISFNSNIPHEVNKLQKQLDDLISELEGYFMTEIIKLGQPQIFSTPHSSSLVDALSVIGRDIDKEHITRMVLSEKKEGENFCVIPVVGMGGIGKTTLVQLVFNDPVVVKKFDLKIWVSVSLDYNVEMITKSIIESATEQVFEFSNLNTLQVKLQKILRGKRLLLVLDGIWNENLSYWDVFRLPFQSTKQGSIIVMTTRSEIVSSSVVDSVPTYHLHMLSCHDCWTIIKHKALPSTNLDGLENLEAIGLKIAEKCKGLPLAAKVIGSVLRFKSGEMEWDALLKEKLWELPEHKNQIYPVLKLSYDNLPGYLKRCFAYCSIFPYNYEFEKDDLVQLWAAEGFIQGRGTKKAEEIGREYFDDLCFRSFFQISNVLDDRKRYKMHVLIHDLARLVSTNSFFAMEENMACFLPVSRNVRHSSLLYQNIQPSTLKVFHKYEKLRTFMLLSEGSSNLDQVPYDFFPKFRCLKVLNLSHSGISNLPDSIEKVRHLRYLNLSSTRLKKLRNPITKLYGLETLKLRNCCELVQLPENLKNLIKLRHLDFDRHHQISSMPIEVGKLTSLETLHAFIVGKNKGHRIEELKNLTCLRGSICITNLENVANSIEAKSAMLKNKQYLEKLELQWNEISDKRVQEEVLMGLEPHDRLKELQITGYSGAIFPCWVDHPSFCKLVSIDLIECKFCTFLPSLGKLPALKYLVIREMNSLRRVDRHQFSGLVDFPSLERLTFHDMPELRFWTGINENDMPRLKELTIDSCPRLETLPSIHFLTSLEKLEISGCLRLQSLPHEGLPPSLKCLIISGSDRLKDRCKVGEGEDWYKIRLIAKVEIDYEEIPTQGRDMMIIG